MKPSENSAWLAIEGWCTPEEGDALWEEARETRGPVIEIGTAFGRSAVALALSGAEVITIDNDSERLKNVAHFAQLCGAPLTAVDSDSRDFAQAWDRPISFLYIDGWHDTENVRADYAAWVPHVLPGAPIWFHDAHGAGWPDVEALVAELVETGACLFDGYVGTIAKLRKAVA